jgi:hypothetical protein
MSAVAVSIVSRQPHRMAADSSGRMKKRKNGLVYPLVEKTIPVNTAMSMK